MNVRVTMGGGDVWYLKSAEQLVGVNDLISFQDLCLRLCQGGFTVRRDNGDLRYYPGERISYIEPDDS